MTSVVIEARRLVDGAGGDGAGWLRIDGATISEVGWGVSPFAIDVRADTIIPSFTDGHVHGALGVDFATVGADPTAAIEHHARAGSTALVASIATGERAATLERVRELSPLVRSGVLAGLHLEGPFLSAARRGAHHLALLRDPDPREIEELLHAADGALAMITLAPELPGAIEAIRTLVSADVVVALGHTDASADEISRAVDAGATVVTHLFNGMPPLHHRAPGPVGAALTSNRLVLEIIGDGHHVDDLAIDLVRRAAPDRAVLVSDAMAATGLGDGRYDLAGSAVVVSDGVAMLADGSSLAGSTTTIAGAVERLLTRDAAAVPDVLALTCTIPRRALRLAPGALVAGASADLVELVGPRVTRVMRHGQWLA